MKTLHAKFSKWITYAKQQGKIYIIFLLLNNLLHILKQQLYAIQLHFCHVSESAKTKAHYTISNKAIRISKVELYQNEFNYLVQRY